MEVIDIVVGFDQREAVAYHVFCQSILDQTSRPVRFLPLAKGSLSGYREQHSDGSNAFTYSRFLSPHLKSYKGYAIYADGDMICNGDITELWELRDPNKAVQVVKHDYHTKVSRKYFGSKNEDYPRKNWSSVIIWNCQHPKNQLLTPDFIGSNPGSFLHRFEWLEDNEIGDIPAEWNWLATEYQSIPNAKLIHYTLGTPCFDAYKNCEMADAWHAALERTTQGIG